MSGRPSAAAPSVTGFACTAAGCPFISGASLCSTGAGDTWCVRAGSHVACICCNPTGTRPGAGTTGVGGAPAGIVGGTCVAGSCGTPPRATWGAGVACGGVTGTVRTGGCPVGAHCTGAARPSGNPASSGCAVTACSIYIPAATAWGAGAAGAFGTGRTPASKRWGHRCGLGRWHPSCLDMR